MPESPPDLKYPWTREDIGDLKAVYVCIKHFQKEDIDFTFKVPKRNGTFAEVQRVKPMLKEGTVQSLLPGCPAYYSTRSTKRTR